MPTIKNVGKRVRMVADRILHPGESKSVTAKQAEAFASDADFEIVAIQTPSVLADTSPKLQGQERNLEEEKPVVKKRRGKKK